MSETGPKVRSKVVRPTRNKIIEEGQETCPRKSKKRKSNESTGQRSPVVTKIPRAKIARGKITERKCKRNVKK